MIQLNSHGKTSFLHAVVSCLFLVVLFSNPHHHVLPVVSAQESCTATDCKGCLSGFGCVWMSDGTCATACGSFPNVDCYYPRIFGNNDEISDAQICEAATTPNMAEQHEACFAITDTNNCLERTGCDWLTGQVEGGIVGGWCVLDLVREIAPPICTATTCLECLADDTCVWMKGDTCKNSCDNFPNTDCYYALQFGAPFSSDTATKVCEVATDLVEENELCSANTDQTSCLESQANTTCSWVSTGTAEAEESGDGHCSYNLGAVGEETEGGNNASASNVVSFMTSFRSFLSLLLGILVL